MSPFWCNEYTRVATIVPSGMEYPSSRHPPTGVDLGSPPRRGAIQSQRFLNNRLEIRHLLGIRRVKRISALVLLDLPHELHFDPRIPQDEPDEVCERDQGRIRACR